MAEVTIDRASHVPLYVQLKGLLLEDIHAGKYQPGEAIPTEHEIMESYEISRNVVRQSIGELVGEGYLIRIKAKGTFVAQDAPMGPINPLDTSLPGDEVTDPDRDMRVVSTEVDDASEQEAALLCVPEGTRIIRIHRIRYIDNVPVCSITSYMQYRLCAFVLEFPLKNESLTHALSRRFDTRIYRTTRKVEARIANQKEAQALEMDAGGVVQYVIRHSRNRTNTIIEASTATYRGDYELNFETFA